MINIGKYTTFGTQNYANYFIDIKTEIDIENIIKYKDFCSSFFCFGGGSNLLFSKNDYNDILFIRNHLSGIREISKNVFELNAGESVAKFIVYLNGLGINSLNPLFGLPGTIGGAVIGNAGSYGIQIGQFVQSVSYFDENIQYLESQEYNYSYRNSNLKSKKIILNKVILDLNRDSGLQEIMPKEFYIQKRKQTQEYLKTCGSYYKNPSIPTNNNIIIEKLRVYNPPFLNYSDQEYYTVPAGWLIQQVGLKGFEYNGVKISNIHANFFVNYNNLESQNIINLSNIVKEKVNSQFSIELEEEVVIV